ncbi:hypothetical protein [Flavobacterium sp. '19STA2R22 D10 B1']|uniref:hypothetical protein n=1 Tax=Flavobacterium aerium TaxID=3037261 RepID=UPI00278C2DFE|nr:hypothetical protein [Flavobacterium sp. '19STA2R22 D10 B1']
MEFEINKEYIDGLIKKHGVKENEMFGCSAIRGSLFRLLTLSLPKKVVVLADDRSFTLVSFGFTSKEPLKTVKYNYSEIRKICIAKLFCGTRISIHFKYDKKIILKFITINSKSQEDKYDVIMRFKRIYEKLQMTKYRSQYS